MTRQTMTRSGLDVDVPQTGIAADAYNVALTALYLRDHGNGNSGLTYEAARHAVTLHRLSGQMHRLDERACNEDLTCRECGGAGQLPEGDDPYGRDCRACAGKGRTTGRRDAKLERQATEIAAHYGLSCYFQGDPRGCSLYIGEAADMNGANYDRGHAVARLGR